MSTVAVDDRGLYRRPRLWTLRRKATPAERFLDALQLPVGVRWPRILDVAESLFGRSIYLFVDEDSKAKKLTGSWVVISDCGIVLLRPQNNEHYQLVSRLHEIAHALVSYSPEGLAASLAGPIASTRIGDKITRLCSAADASISSEAQRLERFVEEVALTLEHRMRGTLSIVEENL